MIFVNPPTYLPTYLFISPFNNLHPCTVMYAHTPKEMLQTPKSPNIFENRCICRNSLWICDVWGFNALLPCSTQEVNQTFQVLDINNNPILKGGLTPNGKIILQTSSAVPASRRLALPPEPAAISSSTALARH